MGIDRSTYIGPYIEVITDPKIYEVNRCRFLESCPRTISDFCPKCGISKKDQFTKRVSRPDFHNILGYDEPSSKGEGLYAAVDMSNKGPFPDFEADGKKLSNCLVPNVDVPGIERHTDGEMSLEFTEEDIENEVGIFAEFYSEEINILQKIPGAEVFIRWGYLIWYH